MPVKTFSPGEILTAADVNQYLNNGLALIAEFTLATSAAFVEFDSIPNAFRALVLTARARCDFSGTIRVMNMRFNGVTGNEYDWQHNIAQAGNSIPDNNSTGDTRMVAGMLPTNDAPATSRSATVLHILGYAQSVGRPSFSGNTYALNFAGEQRAGTVAGQFRLQSVVTSIRVFPSSGDFVADSQFALLGVR